MSLLAALHRAAYGDPDNPEPPAPGANAQAAERPPSFDQMAADIYDRRRLHRQSQGFTPDLAADELEAEPELSSKVLFAHRRAARAARS